MTTHYEQLEVSESASEETISATYRSLMTRFHPDKVAALAKEFRDLAEKRTKEINAAYDILSNATKRRAYDQELRQARGMKDNRDEATAKNDGRNPNDAENKHGSYGTAQDENYKQSNDKSEEELYQKSLAQRNIREVIRINGLRRERRHKKVISYPEYFILYIHEEFFASLVPSTAAQKAFAWIGFFSLVYISAFDNGTKRLLDAIIWVPQAVLPKVINLLELPKWAAGSLVIGITIVWLILIIAKPARSLQKLLVALSSLLYFRIRILRLERTGDVPRPEDAWSKRDFIIRRITDVCRFVIGGLSLVSMITDLVIIFGLASLYFHVESLFGGVVSELFTAGGLSFVNNGFATAAALIGPFFTLWCGIAVFITCFFPLRAKYWLPSLGIS